MAVSKEDKDELSALVIGFLQQSLNDNPGGFYLNEFERLFPQRCDEPHDWYKRYGQKCSLDALKLIQDSVTLRAAGGTVRVSLNQQSDKVDTDLIDLIKGQKQSSKRRARGPNSRSQYSRARNSFALNISAAASRYSGYSRSRLNLESDRYAFSSGGQSYSGSSSNTSVSPPPRSKGSYHQTSRSSAPASRSSTSMVPPQVRTYAPPPKTQPPKSSSSSSTRSSHTSVPIHRLPTPIQPQAPKHREESKSTELDDIKEELCSKIVRLLNKKCADIKLLHLNGFYEIEYPKEGRIYPKNYGHQTLTSLMLDPILNKGIKLVFKAPFPYIRVRDRNDQDKPSVDLDTKSKAKFNAVDVFNISSMLHCLDPNTDEALAAA